MTLADAYMTVSPAALNDAKFVSEHGLDLFLSTYFKECSLLSHPTTDHSSVKLHRLCFLLLRKQLAADQLPRYMCDLDFIKSFAASYNSSSAIAEVLRTIWGKCNQRISDELRRMQKLVIPQLEHTSPDEAVNNLRSLVPLFRALPNAAAEVMVGSEFLDALAAAYQKVDASSRDTLVVLTFFCLVSLLDGVSANRSSFSDHMYSLKANAEAVEKHGEKSLLADLITNTPLISRIKQTMVDSDAGRAHNLEALLLPFRKQAVARHTKLNNRKRGKGKGKATSPSEHAFEGEVHIHRMSLISQIQDLFPDLGGGFIMKLLDTYAENVEIVTAALLEDALPPALRALDRSEPLPSGSTKGLTPRSTPPPPPTQTLPTRHNIHDHDALDRLAVSASNLHIGKAPRASAPTTSDANIKAAILSALSAFDPDDDEHDDTYDAADADALPTPGADADADLDVHEESLFAAWKADPALFARDAETRRSARRARLRNDLGGGWSDEAIEGWAVMLTREPGRVRRLEEKFGFRGSQDGVGRTAWREGDEEDNAGRGGRGRGRGSWGGRGRGESSVGSGTTNEGASARERRRKEASKGRRANHNRRDGRARKVARAGFAG